jgi:hypothetical protein
LEALEAPGAAHQNDKAVAPRFAGQVAGRIRLAAIVEKREKFFLIAFARRCAFLFRFR